MRIERLYTRDPLDPESFYIFEREKIILFLQFLENVYNKNIQTVQKKTNVTILLVLNWSKLDYLGLYGV